MRIKRALVSVSDKAGLIGLAKTLRKLKVEIISTGGTYSVLTKNGIKCRSISDVTGFPEMMDGRVKTLHPKVHGGILFLRNKKSHRMEAGKHGIEPIDLVIVNLYPFQQVVGARRAVPLPTAIENIDIGGPAMIRSAAKNHGFVAVVTDPADYQRVADELRKTKGKLSESTRRTLAVKAFQHTAMYDQAISHYLRGQLVKDEGLPEILDVSFKRDATLRYGENPHQRGALYKRAGSHPKFSFKQLQGKELSYNNILDMDAAIDIMREFSEPAVCVVKHNNPSGISANTNLQTAIEEAVDSDPLSAFGGIVGVNRPVDQKCARRLLDKLSFFEVLVAPKILPAALKLFAVRKNLRVIEAPEFRRLGPYDLRFVKSGVLLQDRDEPIERHLAKLKKNLKVVTKEKPSKEDLESLLFAWRCVKVTKSNAIVLVQGKKTVGIGGGLTSRVDAVKLACEKAGERTEGSVLASDAFFPMPDNIDVAHKNGIRAIIQPGGSIRDSEVIEVCDRHGIAMVFTGERHFKH